MPHQASPAAILAGAYIAKSFINDYNSKSYSINAFQTRF